MYSFGKTESVRKGIKSTIYIVLFIIEKVLVNSSIIFGFKRRTLNADTMGLWVYPLKHTGLGFMV